LMEGGNTNNLKKKKKVPEHVLVPKSTGRHGKGIRVRVGPGAQGQGKSSRSNPDGKMKKKENQAEGGVRK